MADIGVLAGVRVLIVGLGREGVALATYLAGHGVAVTATDMQSEAQLGPAAATLRAAGVTLELGRHPDWLLANTDLLLVSPGVPPEIPFLEQARQLHLPFSTESRLFCYLCPAPIVAITGSSGKTTTTTLVGKMLEAEGLKTWVGGNIGLPLIQVVDEIAPHDKVVMELSSFQLEYFHPQPVPAHLPQLAGLLAGWSPPVAAILNITPNHLDRHPSMKHYVRAKRAGIDYQEPDGVLVLGLDNDMTRTIGYQFGDKVKWFSLEAHMPGGAGVYQKSLAFFNAEGRAEPIMPVAEVKLRGRHNLANILAACLLAREAGASVAAMRQVAATFTGVEHRLQLVREVNRVQYFNDSISTSPERMIAALRSFSEPIVLLAGGRDKHLPWEEAARLMHSTAWQIVLFGEAAPLIQRALDNARQTATGHLSQVHRCATLEEAVQLATQLARPGDVVLLSPGCASFDLFPSYTQRGSRFAGLVNEL